MKALINNNKVIQVSVEEFEVHPSLFWVDCPNDCEFGWILQDGQVMPPVVEQPTAQQILNRFNYSLQEFIDSVAKYKQYESSLHCATYASSTNQQWQKEAQAFIAWRDAVWLYGYSELALIQAGEKPIPTIEEFIEGLPTIVWPN